MTLRTAAPTASTTADARLMISPDNGVTWLASDGNPRPGVKWYALHRPAANTQATVTVGAPGLGLALVCERLTVTLAAGASTPTATTVQVSLINGNSGGTDYRWGTTLGIAAVSGATNGVFGQGDWFASENTALTLEFSAAAGANTIESIAMHGRVVPV